MRSWLPFVETGVSNGRTSGVMVTTTEDVVVRGCHVGFVSCDGGGVSERWCQFEDRDGKHWVKIA